LPPEFPTLDHEVAPKRHSYKGKEG
jgi:hypothetical protein